MNRCVLYPLMIIRDAFSANFSFITITMDLYRRKTCLAKTFMVSELVQDSVNNLSINLYLTLLIQFVSSSDFLHSFTLLCFQAIPAFIFCVIKFLSITIVKSMYD